LAEVWSFSLTISLCFRSPREGALEDQMAPLSTIFVPLFFVMTGMKVDISVFADLRIFQLGFFHLDCRNSWKANLSLYGG
jgi:hypothetical protein